LWNSGSEDWSETALDDFSDVAWTAIFTDLGRAYLPYLKDNAAALAAGARYFDGRYGGIDYPRLPPIRYRARCLATLRRDYAALTAETRARVDARLAGTGVAEALRLPMHESDAQPISTALAGPPRQIGLAQRLRFYFSGTPWDSPP
jgi:hypothetical protein